MALLTKCQTPGAVFSTKIKPGEVNVKIKWAKLRFLTEAEATLLEANIHNALELVLAPYTIKK